MLSLRHFASTQLLRPLTTTVTSVQSKATLPDLSYDYNSLEPVISAEIMQLHHSKHHQTYVNNYNVAEEKLAEAVSKGNIHFLQFLIALHTELMGVIIIFSDISDMFKIVSLWSHLKVFSGIEKKN